MMEQEETIRLLQECDAGVQMGITSIQEVLPYVKEGNSDSCYLHAGINTKNCRRKSSGTGSQPGRGKSRT